MNNKIDGFAKKNDNKCLNISDTSRNSEILKNIQSSI